MKRLVALSLAAAAAASCALIADVHQRTLEPPGSGGGGGTTSSSSSTGGSDGGMGGTSAGGPLCVEGDTLDCYEGPANTEGVGLCLAGEASCSDGAYGRCEGQVVPALEVCDSADDHDCDGFATCQGHWSLSRRFGGMGDELARGAVIDSQGRLVIVGLFQGQVDFDVTVLTSDGGYDYFVAQLSPDGEVQWARRIGGPANQATTPVGVVLDTQDNIYFFGSGLGPIHPLSQTAQSADGLIVSFNDQGDYRGGRLIGGSGTQRVRSLTIDPASGDLIVGMFYSGSFVLDGKSHNTSGNRRIVLARMPLSGPVAWSDDYGADDDDANVYGLAVESDGDILMAGDIEGDGDVGEPVMLNGVPRKAFISRFEAGGTYVTGALFGTAGSTGIRRLLLEPDGNVLVGGLLENNASANFGDNMPLFTTTDGAFLVRLSPSFSGGGLAYEAIDIVGALARGPSGHLTIGLRHLGTTDLGLGQVPYEAGTDVVLAKLAPDLQPQWQYASDVVGDEDIKGVPVDSQGRVWAVGSFQGSITLGGEETLDSAGQSDLFVIRYDP